ncbi:MAG: IS110 family transposase [Bacteroidales bacterium]|nr:IS110 family transposase [Bacteroidales bacterium]
MQISASPVLIQNLHLLQNGSKETKKSQTGKFSGLKIINPDSAGIDVGSSLMQICVPADRCEENNRAFGSCTKDLKAICAWLKECRISKVIMESTGIYWVQLFRMLQQEGFDVYLVNAAEAKNMCGRKTDVEDAEWLMVLLAYGMFKPCYQSDAQSRKLRAYTRLREQYVEMSAVAVQRMQKAKELMNIKLTEVISNVAGLSGLRIIQSILKGERCSEKLYENVDSHCKASKEEIMAALEGTWDDDHMFALAMSYDDYICAQAKISKCDVEIEKCAEAMSSALCEQSKVMKESKKRAYKKNALGVNVEKHCFRAFGVNLMAIPGVSHGTALALLSELGPGFVDKFATSKKFCKWCNLVPNNKISGGKMLFKQDVEAQEQGWSSSQASGSVVGSLK